MEIRLLPKGEIMSVVHRTVIGFVVQAYDEETGECLDQEFCASHDETWERAGEPMTDKPEVDEFPMNMQQPIPYDQIKTS
jgi:hypothetical protein